MENIVLKVLEERRSVRSYSTKQVEKEALDAILRAGTYAATGMNRQSPIIVAVQDAETVNMLSAMNAAVMGREGSDPFYGAPTVVVVLADPTVRTYVEDGSLVIGNMMNAAFSLGVDSCWIHRAKEVFATDEGKALLKKWGIAGEYVGIGNLILGYREGDLPAVRPRKDNYIYYV
ncbi:MAG: nitroreductase [Clostridia bacterium]|nr:nitroreductase [Clostridia bacterium]